ncbi:hypothetical protein CO178_01760, partial [candidate division WWE3 bacterium CG_4_9_14_3_um_filter_34_6]
MPLLFVPFTADAFSLNKTYLVLFVSLISLSLFFVDNINRKRVHVLNLGSYLGMSLLVIGGIASTYFSTNKRISLFGSYGNYESSLYFLIALFIIGFVSANVKLSLSKISKFLIAGVTFSTLFSFFALYGITIPGIGLVPASFSFAGSTNVLAALQAVTVLVALYALGNSAKSKNIKSELFYSFVFVVNAVYMLVALNVLAVGIVVIVTIYLISASKLKLVGDKNVFVPLIFIIFLLVFVNYFSVTRSLLGVENYEHSFRLPVTESWLVSAESVRDFPFTGSGLGTYVFDFTRYRPASLNATPAWDVRFAYPFNDVFTWLATAGLFGLFMYATFWVFVVKDIFYLNREGNKKFLLALILAVIFASLMLLGFNLILYVFLFIVLGISAQNKEHSVFTVSDRNILYALGVASLGLIVLLGINAYQVYSAQNYFMKSLLTNNALERYEFQNMALNHDPRESVYRRVFTGTNLFIATQMSQAEKPTETDIAQIQQLISQSIDNVRLLTEVINPLDVANWETRGQVYDALSGVAENADQFASDAYTNAINLEPTSPRLWLSLGSVYYRQKDYQNAIQAFARSVQLKNDFPNAHYNLAYALKDAGYPIDALTQLEIVARLIPTEGDDYKKISEELKVFQDLADQAKAQQAEEARKQAEGLPEGQNPSEVIRQEPPVEPLTLPEDAPVINSNV